MYSKITEKMYSKITAKFFLWGSRKAPIDTYYRKTLNIEVYKKRDVLPHVAVPTLVPMQI